MRVDWMLKMNTTVALMTLFFVVYFWLLNHAFFPVTVVPRIGIDRWIGFFPGAWPLYVSLWVYVPLAPTLLVSRREMLAYALAAAVLSVGGFICFLFWPTKLGASAIDWAQHPSLSYLKAVDASGNACPSLHVGFAVFTAYWLHGLLRRVGAPLWALAGDWVWCAGIVYSTIAIRQHVALDALAGAVLGLSVALAHHGLLARVFTDFQEGENPCK